MTSDTHRIIFSYQDNEHIPIVLGFSHGLKSKNLCLGKSNIVFRNKAYSIVQKVAMLNNKEIKMLLTYSYFDDRETFVRGFLYIDGKEHLIQFCAMYNSLQIEDACYDRIMIIKLNDDIFEGNPANTLMESQL
jgi:hypothetical protein